MYLFHVSEYVATNVRIFRLQIIGLPDTKEQQRKINNGVPHVVYEDLSLGLLHSYAPGCPLNMFNHLHACRYTICNVLSTHIAFYWKMLCQHLEQHECCSTFQKHEFFKLNVKFNQ